MANINMQKIIEKHRERLRQTKKNMTDDQAKQYRFIWPEWTVGTSYTAEQRIRYEQNLYRVLRTHTAEKDHEPDIDPIRYKRI